MNNLSFDIKTSVDFFNKLREDYGDFCANDTSSRIALNCAMTAWHLTEWVFNEYNSTLLVSFPKLSLYQEHIKTECPSLQIMHDIANGTKHYELKKHVPEVKETKLHKGSYSSSYSRDFDISTLDVEMEDGRKIYFEDEIKSVVHFWKQYFHNTFGISI